MGALQVLAALIKTPSMRKFPRELNKLNVARLFAGYSVIKTVGLVLAVTFGIVVPLMFLMIIINGAVVFDQLIITYY